MRVIKAAAALALCSENNRLHSQMSRCRRQVGRLSGIGLDGMRGQGVEAARQRLRMRAAIGLAHLVFYESLQRANSRCMALVCALPETTPGVLDTVEASARIDDATRRIHELRQEQQDALSQAQRYNSDLDAALAQGQDMQGCTYIDTWAIDRYYAALIRAQDAIVQLNTNILERARQCEAEALAAYQSVQTSYLAQATAAGKGYALTGAWGDVTWVSKMHEDLSRNLKERFATGVAGAAAASRSFLRGELKVEDALLSGKVDGATELLGIPTSGAVSGSLRGFEASIKPFSKMSEKEDGEESASFGVKAKVGTYAAQVGLVADAGLAHMDANCKVLTGAVSGAIGGSLFHDGIPCPSLEAGVEAEVSALSGEGNLRLGTGDYNVHSKGEGKIGTAKAEAKLRLGADGFEAKAGAEAYVAVGEVSWGFTVLGVSLDLSMEGKFGGGGVKAGGQVGATAAEGEIGAGLGVGAGIKIKVDWSGALRAVDNAFTGIGAWWNNLWGPEANRHVTN